MTAAYYAVAAGKCPGIYRTWEDCRENISGYSNARFKKFPTAEEAAAYLRNCNGETILSLWGGMEASASASSASASSASSASSAMTPFGNAADAAEETPMPKDRRGLVAFIDGACPGNGKPALRSCRKAAWAVVWPDYPTFSSEGLINAGAGTEKPTNNRAEFTAAIRAIEQAALIDPTFDRTLYLYTDSLLLLKSATQWLRVWKRNDWRKKDGAPVQNRDLLLELDRLLEERRVVWTHVRAHTDREDWASRWNAEADRAARTACIPGAMDKFLATADT